LNDIDNKYKLILNTPASWHRAEWKDALPTGNGIVGASIYGAVKNETILVNHNDLWHWGKRMDIPDVHTSLQFTRDLMSQKRYDEANSVSSGMLLEAGYQGELYKPCPLADIKIKMEHEQSFKNYERTLNMETGEVIVSWQCNHTNYKRSTFVSRKDDVIVCRFQADKPEFSADVFLQLHKTAKDDYLLFKKEAKVDYISQLKENIFGMQVETKENLFGIFGKVLYCDGGLDFTEQGINIKNASEVIIVFEPYVHEKTETAIQRFKQRIRQLPQSYQKLLESHSEEHMPLFHSAHLSLSEIEDCGCSNEELLLNAYKNEASNKLIEKLWHYGRYLFISGTSEKGNPFPLYGLWGGEYDLLWSHNMANINIQMMYWHAPVGGYSKFIRAMINYYCDLLNDSKENAKQIFGLNGIWVVAGSTPGYGLANQVVPVIMNWIGGAGWLCQHFYDYYRYTKDEKLFEDKILPFMIEAARFYEEYLVIENGEYCIVPSVSPENTPGNMNKGLFQHMSHACPTAKNATMDIAIIKELLTNLVEICNIKNIYTDKCELWNIIIQHLPKYKINEDNAVKEWATDEFTDFYYHRHFSHCYPVFPGKEINAKNAPELYQAFMRSVDLRILGGQSGWSLAFKACLDARFKKGEESYRSLDIICKACLTSSFLSLHNDWRKMGLTLDMSDEFTDESPVQLDAIMGLVGAVQEMLLYCEGTYVQVLPAIPKKWKKGNFKDFHLQTGRISCEWDMDKKFISTTLLMDSDQVINISFPDFISNKIVKINNIKNGIAGSEETISVHCKKNKVIKILIE